MKTRLFILFSAIFSLSFLSVTALEDDCPCRRKTVVKTVVEKKTPPKPVRQLPRYVMYPEGFDNTPDECHSSFYLKNQENFRVKIMPNPVLETLNVIYDTDGTTTVKIELLSCDGKPVRTLLNEIQKGGLKVRSFDIDGKASRGTAYVRFTSGKISKLERIFIL